MAADVIDEVKDFIAKYCKILHLASMPADVRAQFDKYAEYGDFAGDMKHWPPLLALADRLNSGDLSGLPTLSDDALEYLYSLFQDVFETMSQNTDSFKNKASTNKFFNTWYGSVKLFKPKQPIKALEDRIPHFASFLATNEFSLSTVITSNNVYGLGDGFNYASFVSDLQSGKYSTDPRVQNQLLAVAKYVQEYSDGSDSWHPWGRKLDSTLLERYNFSTDVTEGGTTYPSVPLDTEWFTTTYNPGFKYRIKDIFQQLLASSAIREDFKNFDSTNIISTQIQQGIKETDYANETDNTDNKNYVPPIYKSGKTVWQHIGDAAAKLHKNTGKALLGLAPGARRYFSRPAQVIVEAISSTSITDKDGKSHKLQPTDGLKAILDNADAIKSKLKGKSPNAPGHFDWLVSKLKIYSSEMPKSFNKAGRNAKHMKAIAQRIIIDAVQEGKIDAAKSAMEALTFMEYNLFDSRTVDAFGREKMTFFSNNGFSWNSYSVVQGATKVIDWGLKQVWLGVMRIGAGLRNIYQNRNMKLNGKGDALKQARQTWLQQNNADKDSITARIQSIDNDLAVTADVDMRDALNAEKLQLQGNLSTWDDDHKDKYLELMAYWDLLQSFHKTHQFTIATHRMREKLLKLRAGGNSKATDISDAYIADYMNKHRQP